MNAYDIIIKPVLTEKGYSGIGQNRRQDVRVQKSVRETDRRQQADCFLRELVLIRR